VYRIEFDFIVGRTPGKINKICFSFCRANAKLFPNERNTQRRHRKLDKLAAFKLVTGVAGEGGEKGEDVQSGAGLGACCNNSNANVALDPRAERSHKHMQTSSPRLCGARGRDKQGILLMINMSPIKTIEMENTSSFRMHST